MKRAFAVGALVSTFALAGCASTTFESTWKAPDATPIHVEGKKVAAVFMTRDAATRRRAEDAMAREITARGATGVPSYTILPDEVVRDDAASRARLEEAGFAGAVVMRVLGQQTQYTVEPTLWAGPHYHHFWGNGYWRWGWGTVWETAPVRVDTVVRVETLVYSFERDELLWAGVTSTLDPTRVESLVGDLAASVSKKMTEEGLLVS